MSAELTDEIREKCNPNPMIAGSRCPKCRAHLGVATHCGDGSRKPKPGDVTVCSEWQAILQFTVLGLAEAPDDVLIAVAGQDNLKKATAKAAAFQRVERPLYKRFR